MLILKTVKTIWYIRGFQMRGISVAKQLRENTITITGHGFKIELAPSNKTLILDDNNKEILDIPQRMVAANALLLPLKNLFNSKWEREKEAEDEYMMMEACIGPYAKKLVKPVSEDNSVAIGRVMPDGTVYAGYSHSTGTKMYAMPRDSLVTDWYSATDFIKAITNKYGYNGSKQVREEDLEIAENDDGGWRLPTWYEIEQLSYYKDLIGNFDNPDLYFSGTKMVSDGLLRCQSFQYNVSSICLAENFAAVRCVRTEPRLKI